MRTDAVLGWFVIGLLLSAELPAQVVRGRVTEVNSTAPVAGAVVSLLAESTDSAIVSVLTASAGDYAVRAPAGGRYRLAVKRIGVRRFVSAPFAIAEGETRAINVPIDAVALTLPTVNVSGLCATRPSELAHIASLWDEVRTALAAIEISVRDRMMQAQISRYRAELEPTSLRVLFDWRSDDEMMVEQPFTSLSGDSLSAVGYWRELPSDSVEYLAPDVRALASTAFLRDHCFSLAPVRRERPELVGLNFTSRNRRVLPDITGTVWIDAHRYELRLIEFRYTRLPPNAPALANAGGEVHFRRLPTGAWIVERWFIRTPYAIVGRDRIGEPAAGSTRRILIEGGGTVMADGLSLTPPTAAVAGVVLDSADGPLAAAVVRVVGTNRQTLTAEDGTYRLDSLPRGSFPIVAHNAGYDSLALLVGAERVELKTGETLRVDFKAPDAAGLRALACPMIIRRPAGSGVLRLLMLDSATASPLSDVVFVVAWPPTSATRMGRPDRERYRVAVTDNRGAASFCDLPHGVPLELSRIGPGTLSSVVMTFQTSRSGMIRRTLIGTIER